VFTTCGPLKTDGNARFFAIAIRSLGGLCDSSARCVTVI
jgi:hypothetical protein